jgi:hypothetical protein
MSHTSQGRSATATLILTLVFFTHNDNKFIFNSLYFFIFFSTEFIPLDYTVPFSVKLYKIECKTVVQNTEYNAIIRA